MPMPRIFSLEQLLLNKILGLLQTNELCGATIAILLGVVREHIAQTLDGLNLGIVTGTDTLTRGDGLQFDKLIFGEENITDNVNLLILLEKNVQNLRLEQRRNVHERDNFGAREDERDGFHT